MIKSEYLERLNLLGLDKSKYCIYAGGIMLMYDLKSETKDIDLIVDPNYIPELLNKYGARIVKIRDDKYVLDNEIDLVTSCFDPQQIDIIDNYPVCSLLLYKERLLLFNREKDAGKVAVIDEYMGRTKGAKNDKY